MHGVIPEQVRNNTAYGLKKRSWPVSRVLSWTVIPLGARLLVRSSSLPGSGASHVIAPLFGFAPDGGYRVSRPSRRTAIYSSLWPCSSPRGVRPLAVILLCGARTFLPLPCGRRRLSSQLRFHFTITAYLAGQSFPCRSLSSWLRLARLASQITPYLTSAEVHDGMVGCGSAMAMLWMWR